MDPALEFREARKAFAALDPAPFRALAQGSVFAQYAADPDFPALVTTSRYKIILNSHAPFAQLYPSKAVGEKTAAGSLVHVLAIPVEPIYNAASLEAKEHTHLVGEMAEGIREFMRNPVLRAKAVAQVRSTIERFPEYPAWKAVFEEMARVFQGYDYTEPDDVELSFHVHPSHSVPYLHMHGVQANLRTNKKLDYKNTPVHVVLDVLEGELVDELLKE